MINSLEEAISREEEMAKEQEKLACSLYERQDYEISKNCIWCAKEHRQRAEWLRELKRDREVLTELDAAIECYENCECCQGFREYPTSQFIKDVIRINKEVNADDGDSDCMD